MRGFFEIKQALQKSADLVTCAVLDRENVGKLAGVRNTAVVQGRLRI